MTKPDVNAGKTPAPSAKKRMPFCPLLSAGTNDLKVCLQEDCAWWTPSTKTCVAYIIGYNNVLEIKQKQGK